MYMNPWLSACILLAIACGGATQPLAGQHTVLSAVRSLQSEAETSAEGPAEGPVPAAQVLQTSIGQQSVSQQTAEQLASASLDMQKVRLVADQWRHRFFRLPHVKNLQQSGQCTSVTV